MRGIFSSLLNKNDWHSLLEMIVKKIKNNKIYTYLHIYKNNC